MGNAPYYSLYRFDARAGAAAQTVERQSGRGLPCASEEAPIANRRAGCNPAPPFYSSCQLSRAITDKSSRVVVSPFTSPPLAISFNRRRMILPLRVLGSASLK